MTDIESVSDQPRPGVEAGSIERLEELLSECEARYERLVESSPDIIYRMRARPDVGFEYINSAAERILGYPTEKFLEGGLVFMQSIMIDEQVRRDNVEAAAGRKFFPVRLIQVRRGDGAAIWLEVHNVPVYDDTGTLVAQEGTVRDVSEREKALAELRASEERQRRLTESLPDLLMRVDEAGTFLERLPTASRQPAKLFLGKTVFEVIPAQAQKTAQQALRKAVAGEASAFRCRIDVWGDERSYEFRLVPTGFGELLAFLRDVTGEVWAAGELERRRSRDELEGTVENQIGIRNPYQFTFREFTVLHLVAKGAPDKEIANELGIALSTVNKHVSNTLGKMNAASRTEAGVRAVQEGLVSV